MALRNTVEERIFVSLVRRGLRSRSPELYPGVLESLRTAFGNERARRHLANASDTVEAGRASGARV